MVEGLVLAGLAAGAILAVLILLRALQQRNPLGLGLGSLILAAAAAGALILISQRAPQEVARPAELAELALTMALGPTLLLIVAALLGRRVRAVLIVGFASGGLALLIAIEARLGGDPILLAVPIQVGFTLWGWYLWLSSPTPPRRGSPAWKLRRIALWLLLAVSMANLASLVRLTLPEIEWLRALVPWTLSLISAALLVGMLWAYIGRQAPVLNRVAPANSEEARMIGRLVTLIVEEDLFRDPGFTIEAAAIRSGQSSETLAAAIARTGDGSFSAMLQSIRLDQARAMLAEPAEQATSIDAISLLCGFRSRSAFYEAFQRRFGETPGAFRSRVVFLSGA